MWKWLLVVVGLMGGGLLTGNPAQAQTPFLQWQCVAPSSTKPGGGYCPVNSTYPLPTSASGTGSTTITGALPAGGNTIGSVNLASPLPAGAAVIGSVNLTNTYPVGATVVTSTSTAAAGANNISMPAVAAKTNYLCHFAVTGGGATAAAFVTVTVNGVGAGFIAYNLAVPAGAATSITPLIVTFTPCLQANAVNSALLVNVPSFGAGNTSAAASLFGYVQ